jgi:twitching motility protein PilT
MNQSLASLYQRRLISLDDALGRSSDTEELRNMLGIAPGEAGKKKAAGAA